ncbi:MULTISPECIES: pyridoxal kinase PdxY [Pseudovibrio]|uniref:pyridoxal kinase PdxY n=1 Tax=Stappiaceae TaxID=2821832 RepID=UPI0023669145|nr:MULTISPECIES: pyridoxal kinase PdxY [Pseudovibrio]MDD7910781.1 pyridoxal kinase PdxY [Pseudovibrio exalbescens]MDX5593511.1 pyridoxal kinase PdxY [Pseudovibrio sp. SPO723]
MSILSIQSHVAFGHVGNAAAVFPLQLMGQDTWPIHTVQFSNHTGYGAWTGRVFDGEMIRELVDGIEARGALPKCDAILSGYMGGAPIVEAVVDTVSRVRAVSPEAIYCCDPVMGDVGRGIFVQEGIPDLIINKAIPQADIITPNLFELELASGRTVKTLADALEAAHALRARGPKVVVVSSLLVEETADDSINVLVVSGEGAWMVKTPILPLPIAPNGAGDMLSSLFLGNTLRGYSPDEALSRTVSALYQVLKTTLEEGTRELQIVKTGFKLLEPDTLFKAEKVA